MLITNTLYPFASFFDIYETTINKIKNLGLVPVNTIVKSTARKFLQIISQNDERYTPEYPILSLLVGQYQHDERGALSWRAIPLNEHGRLGAIKIFEIADLKISWIPMQITGTFDIAYIGTSSAEVNDFQLHMLRTFNLQKYVEYTITSSILLPETALKSYFTDEELEKITTSSSGDPIIPYTIFPLSNTKQYIIPFVFKPLIRLTGYSDTSKLFGDTELPEFSTSFSFEFITYFPNYIIFDYLGKIDYVKIMISSLAKTNIITDIESAILYDRINDVLRNKHVFEYETKDKVSYIDIAKYIIPDTNDVSVVVIDTKVGGYVKDVIVNIYESPADSNAYRIEVDLSNWYPEDITIDDNRWIVYVGI